MSDPSHHLALVATLAEPVRQAHRTNDLGAGTHRLEATLRGRIQTRAAYASLPDTVDRSATKPRIPFAIRMTAEQVLEVADDADIRAEILDDVANAHLDGRAQPALTRIPTRADIDRRVLGLREVAAELRRIAANLQDSWGAPKTS